MAEAPPQTEAPLAAEPPSNLQENQEEEAPIQVIIDSESEDEARAEEAHFKRNGGLPYDDHNYGNLELKNRGNDEEDEQPFPIIGPLDEYGNVLPIAPPPPQPPHQTHFHPRAAAPNQPKQYNAHFISSSGDHHHHHFAPTRNEPSIVARAPATNSYRVTTESGVGGASGYQTGSRTILQQTRQIMRPRAELSQSGQPIYTQVHHHQPGTLRAQPAGSGTNINSPMIPRRQPPQQQGQPGAYQHIVQTTPAGLIRRTIPQRPAILGQANRGIAATAGSVAAAAAAAGEHYSPVHRRMADVAPHRMTQEQRLQQQASLRPPAAPLPPPPQQISAPQQPQQFTNLEGVAPMLVPARGSKLLVRGRAGSHGQKRREDGSEMMLQESPAKAAAPQADADSPAKMGAVKPPHRMSQEEKNAHIAKHLEKDKMPDPIAAATAENNVASVVLAVAEAVNAANLGGARPSTLPTPSTSTPTNNTQQTAKEKDEITRLANDIRLSCESFVPAPPPTSSSAHQTPSKSHQNGWNSSQNGGGATDKELTEARVKQHIETARKQLEEEGNLQHQQQNMVPIIGAERKRAVSSFLAGLTPNDQPARQRGRPKGSTGTRNRWSTSSNQQDVPIPPGNVVRIGQGVRTMPAQPPIAHPLPLPLPLTHPLAPIPSAHLPAVQIHQSQQPPPINSPGVNKDSDSESDGVKQGGESGGDFGDDWTMRCHCEMSHGDGHCVECEKCGNWQHTLCMGLKPSEADKMNNYQCEVCQPRILSITKTEARKIQKRELDRLRKATAKKEKKSGGARKSLPKDATKRRSLTASALTKPDPPPYSDANDYSRTAQRLLKTLGATSGASGLLEDAKSRTRAKRMFVEENIEGLVSTAPVDPRQVIIELSGYVCRPEETTREAGGIAGVYQYDGLMKGPTGEDIGPSTGNELICIDAKKKGNDSRYTRRSCQPNCVLKHVLDEKGILGVMVVATRFIPYNTEITLPFDNDWRQRKNKLTCADHFGEESTNCGPEVERARLNPPILNVPQPPKRPAIFDSILKNEEDLVDAAQRADIQRKEREAAKQAATPKTPKAVAPKPPPKARAVSLEKSPSVGRKSEEGEKKLSREERRTQQYEILFSRQEEEAKKKESKRKSTGKTADKKEKSVEKEMKEEEPKIEPKEEEKIPETPEKPAEKRTSARRVSAKIAESTPTRELSARQKKKRLESEAESEASASASISKTTTTSATVPPLKRWKAEAAKESAQNQKVESPMVFKKQWMKRHIAEVVSEVSPSKKTRRSSVEKFTFGEIRAQFRENARLVAEKLGKQWYDPSRWMTKEDKVSRKVRNMIEDQRKQDEEKERRERREKRESESERRKKAEETVEKKKEEETEIVEKVEETQTVREQEVAAAPTTSKIVEEEAKKVTRKRLSVAEYKMRKSGNLPTGIYHGPIDTTSSQKDESPVSQKPSSSGFIPSTEGASGQNLAQLPFVAPPSPPKSFYPPPTGVVLEDPRLLRESARYAPPPPPPPPPRGSQHLPRTPPHPSSSSSSSSSKPPSTVTQSADESPRMSLKDRLFSEFGLGSGSPSSSSSTRKQSPPPPPPTRSRASRWQ